MPTWTLRDHGRDLAVRDDGDGRLRLELDGTDVDEAQVGRLGDHEFELDRLDGRHQKVKAERGLRGTLRTVTLVESGNGELPVTVPFVPPSGSRARRLYDLREAHPNLWAARHIAGSGLGLLGIGALLSAFLSRFVPKPDLSWLPNPDVDLPDLFGWVPDLFGWVPDLFAWVPDWDLGWLKIVLGVVVAIALTVNEVERRKKLKERAEDQRPSPDSS
ncbi:hypothetical protein [Aeromicrobium sp.]|uniref:hypothetical protein n=1 Tax=Aeromicrobium sp. TaxID=1871063 RepID=UPI0028A692AD|nr:hypothetical protein [Aeromicrobium sp.]